MSTLTAFRVTRAIALFIIISSFFVSNSESINFLGMGYYGIGFGVAVFVVSTFQIEAILKDELKNYEEHYYSYNDV